MKTPTIKPFVCTCGGLIAEIAAGARFSDDPHFGGWYFECKHCNSTVFIAPGSSRILEEAV